ncbi:hypothetical protein DAEQUDRAFT_770321 [Daedalea quercina L-15889]|uniref:Uncharacterized protein n=1 Tax=Daedalea quercina L-15889 TaxID=1314783 RepID=A0A165KYD8_9APHY|nr:hypothetical protein DAEQUDRAFT_770321 [Daedalea quercina L-15889]
MDPPHPQCVLRPRVQDCLAAVHRLIREPDHRLEFYNYVGGLVAAERQAHEIRTNLSDLLTEGAQCLRLDLGIIPQERHDWDNLVWRITEEYVLLTILEEDTSDESGSGNELSMSRSGGSSPTPLRCHPTPGPIRTRPSPIRRPPPVFSVPLTHANYRASRPSQSSTSSEADEFIEDIAESDRPLLVIPPSLSNGFERHPPPGLAPLPQILMGPGGRSATDATRAAIESFPAPSITVTFAESPHLDIAPENAESQGSRTHTENNVAAGR